MLSFQVTGMTCAHCEAAVTRAVHSVNPTAEVTVGRAANQVTVDGSADPEAVRRAVEAEGYSVTRVA
ncbi:heavy-metal-associated domain-containing protein [Roseitranquillus sediminis]|uniref:heavy-metal-associated domain-containing protein n=1 Tax=Roseitranquillus sediminis TaxID=2809051 RepID=UPI001D0CCA0F|nr:heavy-metal-associated domain-containing protein [Roseitranquillus sediminis]MBM9593415.1 heavy-metal-associated domain-containing protein [Roseitranquillus sediminis]